MPKRQSSSSSSSPSKAAKTQQPNLTSFFGKQGEKDYNNNSDRNNPIPSSSQDILLLSSDSDSDSELIIETKNENGNNNKKGKERERTEKPDKPASFLQQSTKKQKQETDISYPLDKDIFEFDPFHDVDTSAWPKRKHQDASSLSSVSVPYAFLTAAFVMISSTKSRLLIVTVLTNALRTVRAYEPSALIDTVYLITNHIGPSYDSVELGVGSQVLTKVLKDVCALGPKDLKVLWNKHGDPGDVAFAAKHRVRTLVSTSPLLISGVYSTLLKIASLKGQRVTENKASLVQKMMIAAKGEEVRFLVRTLVSNLRIGAVRLTVSSSLARAFCLIDNINDQQDEQSSGSKFLISKSERNGFRAIGKESKEDPKKIILMKKLARAEKRVRRIFSQHPNYGDIIPALLKGGLPDLPKNVTLTVSIPLNPMLGQITRDVSDVAKRLPARSQFAAEWKYDGQRVQIHCCNVNFVGEGNTNGVLLDSKAGKYVGHDNKIHVRLFSRHLEDMTEKYPDILALVPNLLTRDDKDDKPWSFIVDAEICAIEPTDGTLQTFQTLSNRAKKDVKLGDIKVRVGIFAFDLMYLNGKSLLKESFRRRRQLLKDKLPPYVSEDVSIARFDHVRSYDGSTEDIDTLRKFMNEAIENKCEGLMVKALDHDKRLSLVQDSEDEEEIELEIEIDQIDDNNVHEDPGGDDKQPRRKKPLMSSYEPDKRADSWLKCKRDYGELGDSFDFVPIGAWHGSGRKAGWWSPILLALYDPDSGSFQAVCKCISGFTDQFYKDLNERYPKDSDSCSSIGPLTSVDTGGLTPDVFWLPQEVWEIRGADITLSPVYNAAQGQVDERGLSLRFPRFYKAREDKSVEQSTTPEEFADAYRRQIAR